MPLRPRNPEDDAAFLGMGMVIAEIRERREIGPEDFATEIGVDRRTLGRIEQGEANADWATLRVIAKTLDLPLDRLIELAEEAAPGDGGEEWRYWSRRAEAARDR